MTTQTVGNVILFVGGYIGSGYSNAVDIYNVTSNTWTNTTLSQARYNYLQTIQFDNRVLFFDRRQSWTIDYLIVVDVFDSLNGMWNSKNITLPRAAVAWTKLRDIVAFGGGWDGFTSSSVVDIYNATSNTWFTTNLSQPRHSLASTSTTSKIYFGGGVLSNIVDIFDFNSSSSQFPSIVPQSQQIPTSSYSTSTTVQTPSSSLNNSTGKIKFNLENYFEI
jgi:hypothetical protein